MSDDKKPAPGFRKPKVVQVSVTDRCQCACAHCGVSYLRRGRRKDPSLAEIKRIFLDLKTFNCEFVDLFGGEPTLRRDLGEIVALGKAMGFSMLLETNGVLLDRALALRLKKAGLALVYLSLDDYRQAAHDASRGRPGVFKAAVRAMNVCRDIGLPVHISTVPKSKDYFTGGDMARLVRFCLANGAEKVRVLFPSCVGNWAFHDPEMTEREERGVWSYVPRRLHKYIYVEDMENNKVLGEETSCPAKSIFCHITTEGKVLPCPYLPIAFGDLRREPLLSVFERVQGHPCMKERGTYCPSRDPGFLKRRLAGVCSAKPFVEAEAGNLVCAEGGCNNGCRSCGRDLRKRTGRQVLAALAAVEPGYSAVDLYGGEPFARKDIDAILSALPQGAAVNLHSNARLFSYPENVARLKKYRVHCVKTPLFSLDRARYEAESRVRGSYAQALAGIRNLCRAGIPVSVFLPEAEAGAPLEALFALGVASVSSYSADAKDPLRGAVLCFGPRLGRTRLLRLGGQGAA